MRPTSATPVAPVARWPGGPVARWPARGSHRPAPERADAVRWPGARPHHHGDGARLTRPGPRGGTHRAPPGPPLSSARKTHQRRGEPLLVLAHPAGRGAPAAVAENAHGSGPGGGSPTCPEAGITVPPRRTRAAWAFPGLSRALPRTCPHLADPPQWSAPRSCPTIHRADLPVKLARPAVPDPAYAVEYLARHTRVSEQRLHEARRARNSCAHPYEVTTCPRTDSTRPWPPPTRPCRTSPDTRRPLRHSRGRRLADAPARRGVRSGNRSRPRQSARWSTATARPGRARSPRWSAVARPGAGCAERRRTGLSAGHPSM